MTHRYFWLHLWNSSLMISLSVCFHSVSKYCLAVFNDPWTRERTPQFNVDYTHEQRHCKQPQSVLLYRLVCSLQILSAFTLPSVFVHSLVFFFLSFLPSFFLLHSSFSSFFPSLVLFQGTLYLPPSYSVFFYLFRLELTLTYSFFANGIVPLLVCWNGDGVNESWKYKLREQTGTLEKETAYDSFNFECLTFRHRAFSI